MLLALGIVVGIRLSAGVPVGALTRDPAALTGTPPYLGLLSHLGVLLWCAAATVCLLAGALVSRVRSFLLACGALTVALLLDDLFMLHETMLPALTGLPEAAFVSAYGVATAALLVGFRAEIRRTDWPLLAWALGSLAFGVVADALPELLAGGRPVADVPPAAVDAYLLLEDGAKFAGIVAWLAYFAGVGGAALAPSAALPAGGEAAAGGGARARRGSPGGAAGHTHARRGGTCSGDSRHGGVTPVSVLRRRDPVVSREDEPTDAHRTVAAFPPHTP